MSSLPPVPQLLANRELEAFLRDTKVCIEDELATIVYVDANDFWVRTGTDLTTETAGDTVSLTGAFSTVKTTGINDLTVGTGNNSRAAVYLENSINTWSVRNQSDGNFSIYNDTQRALLFDDDLARPLITGSNSTLDLLGDVRVIGDSSTGNYGTFDVLPGASSAGAYARFQDSTGAHGFVIGFEDSDNNTYLNSSYQGDTFWFHNDITFNAGATDSDFTINKNVSGTAYVYDAGTDIHTFSSDTILEADVGGDFSWDKSLGALTVGNNSQENGEDRGTLQVKGRSQTTDDRQAFLSWMKKTSGNADAVSANGFIDGNGSTYLGTFVGVKGATNRFNNLSSGSSVCAVLGHALQGLGLPDEASTGAVPADFYIGVAGFAEDVAWSGSTNVGVYGKAIEGDTASYAGYFDGDVSVVGNGSLALAVGTTTKCPLVFQAGSLLTTPTPGCMEHDGARFYLTEASDDRRVISLASDAKVTDTTVVNTTTETTLFSVDVQPEVSVAGKVYRIPIFGKFSTASASESVTLRFKFNGTSQTVVFSGKVVTDSPWHATLEFYIRTTGVSGTYAAFTHCDADNSSFDTTPTTGTIDTTITTTLSITAEWGAAKAGNTLTCMGALLEDMN